MVRTLSVWFVMLALILVGFAAGGCGGAEMADAAAEHHEEPSESAEIDQAEIDHEAHHAGESAAEVGAEAPTSDDAHAHNAHASDAHAHGAGDTAAMAAAHNIPAEAAAVPNPVTYDTASIEAGAALFAQTCALCHGPEGAGDGPGAVGLDPKPANLTDAHVQANSDGGIFYIISEGRAGTAMVGWDETYNATQRWQLVNLIRSLAE